METLETQETLLNALWGPEREGSPKGIGDIYCCCSVSRVRLFETPWTAARQASLSFTISRSLLKLMSIELVISPTVSSAIVPFSSCLQSFPSPRSFLMIQLFTSAGQSIVAYLQHQSFQ